MPYLVYHEPRGAVARRDLGSPSMPEPLQEQIAYYRARAPEYDESLRDLARLAEAEGGAAAASGLGRAMQRLRTLGPFDHALELALRHRHLDAGARALL